MIDTSAAGLLDLGTSVVLLALAAAAWTARGRDPAILSFGALCFGLAGFYLHGRTTSADGGALIPWPIAGVLFVLSGAGFAGLALLVPRRLGPADRAAAIAGAVVFVMLVATLVRPLLSPIEAFHAQTGPPAKVLLGVQMSAAALGYASMSVYPLRFVATAPHEDRERRALALLALGTTLFTVGIARGALAGSTSPITWGYSLAVLAPALLWLHATRGPGSALARSMALAIPAIVLGALLLSLIVPDLVYPIGRVLGVGVLGYAVLSGKVAGLDVRVRFALSRSTVAAVFIAVFFVASEGAQILFGAGNAWVGLLAAGALVFAMAPLQRAAERLAERAVPVAPSAAVPVAVSEAASGDEDAYRRAVRLAMRGGITRTEEHDLAVLADRLGIRGKRALEIRDDLEAREADR